VKNASYAIRLSRLRNFVLVYSSRDSIIQPARSALPCPILHVAPIANLMHFCCLTYRTNARRIAPHHTPPQSTPPHPHCILWTAPQQDKFPLFPVSLITLITPHSPSALPSRLAAPRHTSPHLAAPHCTPLHPTAPHCASLRLTAPHCAAPRCHTLDASVASTPGGNEISSFTTSHLQRE
jgi:hypothetical protein